MVCFSQRLEAATHAPRERLKRWPYPFLSHIIINALVPKSPVIMGPYGMGFPSDVANNGWRLYILSLVMIVSAGLFVVARLITRASNSQVGWDDLTITVSLFMSIMVSVCMQMAIENGYGMHKEDLATPQLRYALKLFFFAQTSYKISVCFNELSAIFFCLRIFVSERFRIAAFIIMSIIIAWSIGGVAATILQCILISGAWNKSLHAQCIDSGQFWVAYAVMNILTDVLVLVLPNPVHSPTSTPGSR